MPLPQPKEQYMSQYLFLLVSYTYRSPYCDEPKENLVLRFFYISVGGVCDSISD